MNLKKLKRQMSDSASTKGRIHDSSTRDWNPRKITDPKEIAIIENLMNSKGARLSDMSF